MTPIGFWRIAEAEPDRRALVLPDGAEVTYGALAASSNQVLHGLRAAGCRPEDVIAVLLPNGRAFLELYLACIQGGLYITPLNYHLTPAEVSYVLGDSESVVLVAHERFAEVARQAADDSAIAPGRRYSVGTIAGFRPFSALLAGQPTTRPDDRRPGDRMIYTSGTTGAPKGIRRQLPQLDVDEVVGADTPTRHSYGFADADGVHLGACPLYHSAPSSMAATALHSGNTLVLMDRWDAEETLRLVERHRVTTSHLVPTMFHRLLQLPEETRARYDVSSLRRVVHGAAPITRLTKRRMIDWWGPKLYEYFGSTEVSATGVTSEDWLARPGTVGRGEPGTEVRVVYDDGVDCPPGTAGRIYMRSARRTPFEYYKVPEKTAAARLGDWVTVGDIGYLDEDGFLFPIDRESNMIISGGVNIYPAEAEAVLLEHEAVGDVAVFGVPNEEWGEEVKAVVELRAGVAPSDALAEELMAFCRDRLSHFKCPRSVDFHADLPRADNGKLYKRRIRDDYWAGRDSRIH